MSQPAHALTKVSEHTNVYRGFGITRLPRNKFQPVTRYHVSQGDQSYGKFDAQAQATGYIDELYQQREGTA
ncbi:hypothetical protein KGP26_20480 [Serratia sp. JSRIV002]|uniref:hypothetical protein n=1 Tax=Serratia sp. JSRIV002 TaxID=2831894 RepID=UPI001CBE5D93|nr:hypothetical protein [Serratia sp. JSRIV002]UAN50102.1 hypothetical protein KGP26_20480 [Serratia sp. JSRIV002]